MRKIIYIVLVSALLSVLLASCGKSADEKVTITFWSTTEGKETEFFEKRIQSFEKEHPGIRVNMVHVPFGVSSNQYKTAILGDETVDAFRADNSWIPEYAELDILYPLNELATQEDLSTYVESALQSTKYKEKVYGLPSVIEAPALMYNKRLLKEAGYDKAPATMDEMLEMAEAITDGDQYGIYLHDDSYFAMPYLWAFGGGTITDDRKIEIASPNSVKAFEFMRKLKEEGVTQPYPTFEDGYNVMMRDFKEGKTAMIINGPWAVSDVLSAPEFRKSENLGIAPIPKGPGGQGSPVGGHSLVISKYSKHPKETYELISYLTNAESETLQAKELKTLPTQSAAYQDESLKSDPIVQSFKAQLDAAKARPSIPEGAQMFGDFTPNLADILLGNQSAQEGAQRIQAAWKDMLGQN